ncbi:Protein of unknown function [Pyronema omphalodes CBS 100304]|uniref:Uncharacterized protein n=1 Tax=Pyronema omphalodes (strain CBS 100304) TaxID=1076935 RepID=U4L6Z7_PYROM|nr:Protein of unknown function [Pyronema omphalodes CBS 100304]
MDTCLDLATSACGARGWMIIRSSRSHASIASCHRR